MENWFDKWREKNAERKMKVIPFAPSLDQSVTHVLFEIRYTAGILTVRNTSSSTVSIMYHTKIDTFIYSNYNCTNLIYESEKF
jgi:hypothetical protein